MLHPMTDVNVSQQRLAELRRLLVMDSTQDQAYDDLTRIAAEICSVPMALITLLDDQRNWFKSRIGIQAHESPSENSFCETAMASPSEVMIIRDAQQDPRFVNHPMVAGDPYIRFYAAAPLVSSRGLAVGTICVIDREPRDLTPDQTRQLSFLAQQVMTILEGRLEKNSSSSISA